MTYVYYVTVAQPNSFAFGGVQYYFLEIFTEKKITQFEHVQALLPTAKKKIKEETIKRGKAEGFENLVKAYEAMPIKDDDGTSIISFSLLRKITE